MHKRLHNDVVVHMLFVVAFALFHELSNSSSPSFYGPMRGYQLVKVKGGPDCATTVVDRQPRR